MNVHSGSPFSQQPLSWQQEVEKTLLEGCDNAAIERLEAFLAEAPNADWWHRPSGFSYATHLAYRGMPCWTALFFNTDAPQSFHVRALALLHRAGVDVYGHYTRMVTPSPQETAAGAKPHSLEEPVLWGLVDRCEALNPEAAALLVEHQAWLQATSASDPLEALQPAIHWMAHLFSVDHRWPNAQLARPLVWATLQHVPALLAGEPAQRLWALGLGFLGSLRCAGRSLRYAAMAGLDATEVLAWRNFSQAQRNAWDAKAFGAWSDAPAWAWATDQGLLLGSGLVVDEIRAAQPRPWDPNALLSGGLSSLGMWLLERALADHDAGRAGQRVREMDALDLDWAHGASGERPYDRVAATGQGEAWLGAERWAELSRLAVAEHLDDALSRPDPSRTRPRI